MKAYKLLRIKKDGKLYPLFINKTVATPIGEWMEAECHPTKGFAIRQGWHCCFQPVAPHLKMKRGREVRLPPQRATPSFS